MFCGCGFALIWPKKSSYGPILEDKPIYSPYIIKGIQEDYSADREKVTVVRFHKPSRIYFRRPAMPLPEPIVMEDLASNTREE